MSHMRFCDTENAQGTPGFEPGTSRSAVECSTTELYPQRQIRPFTFRRPTSKMGTLSKSCTAYRIAQPFSRLAYRIRCRIPNKYMFMLPSSRDLRFLHGKIFKN